MVTIIPSLIYQIVFTIIVNYTYRKYIEDVDLILNFFNGFMLSSMIYTVIMWMKYSSMIEELNQIKLFIELYLK